MATPFRLLLPGKLYQEMVQQARDELPNECCGMLAGRIESDSAGAVGYVVRRFPLVNAAASAVAFTSEPESMLAAEKARRREKLEFLAVYHSHPDAPPIPSRTDLAHNYSPDTMNLILSLRNDIPQIKAWWLENDKYRAAELELIDGDGLKMQQPAASEMESG